MNGENWYFFRILRNEDNGDGNQFNGNAALEFAHSVFDPINPDLPNLVDTYMATDPTRTLDIAEKLLRYAQSIDTNGIIEDADATAIRNFITAPANANWLEQLDAWAAANPIPLTQLDPVPDATVIPPNPPPPITLAPPPSATYTPPPFETGLPAELNNLAKLIFDETSIENNIVSLLRSDVTAGTHIMELISEYVHVNGINLNDSAQRDSVVGFIRDHSSDPNSPTYWVTSLESWHQSQNAIADTGALAQGAIDQSGAGLTDAGGTTLPAGTLPGVTPGTAVLMNSPTVAPQTLTVAEKLWRDQYFEYDGEFRTYSLKFEFEGEEIPSLQQFTNEYVRTHMPQPYPVSQFAIDRQLSQARLAYADHFWSTSTVEGETTTILRPSYWQLNHEGDAMRDENGQIISIPIPSEEEWVAQYMIDHPPRDNNLGDQAFDDFGNLRAGFSIGNFQSGQTPIDIHIMNGAELDARGLEPGSVELYKWFIGADGKPYMYTALKERPNLYGLGVEYISDYAVITGKYSLYGNTPPGQQPEVDPLKKMAFFTLLQADEGFQLKQDEWYTGLEYEGNKVVMGRDSDDGGPLGSLVRGLMRVDDFAMRMTNFSLTLGIDEVENIVYQPIEQSLELVINNPIGGGVFGKQGEATGVDLFARILRAQGEDEAADNLIAEHADAMASQAAMMKIVGNVLSFIPVWGWIANAALQAKSVEISARIAVATDNWTNFDEQAMSAITDAFVGYITSGITQTGAVGGNVTPAQAAAINAVIRSGFAGGDPKDIAINAVLAYIGAEYGPKGQMFVGAVRGALADVDGDGHADGFKGAALGTFQAWLNSTYGPDHPYLVPLGLLTTNMAAGMSEKQAMEIFSTQILGNILQPSNSTQNTTDNIGDNTGGSQFDLANGGLQGDSGERTFFADGTSSSIFETVANGITTTHTIFYNADGTIGDSSSTQNIPMPITAEQQQFLDANGGIQSFPDKLSGMQINRLLNSGAALTAFMQLDRDTQDFYAADPNMFRNFVLGHMIHEKFNLDINTSLNLAAGRSYLNFEAVSEVLSSSAISNNFNSLSEDQKEILIKRMLEYQQIRSSQVNTINLDKFNIKNLGLPEDEYWMGVVASLSAREQAESTPLASRTTAIHVFDSRVPDQLASFVFPLEVLDKNGNPEHIGTVSVFQIQTSEGLKYGYATNAHTMVQGGELIGYDGRPIELGPGGFIPKAVLPNGQKIELPTEGGVSVIYGRNNGGAPGANTTNLLQKFSGDLTVAVGSANTDMGQFITRMVSTNLLDQIPTFGSPGPLATGTEVIQIGVPGYINSNSAQTGQYVLAGTSSSISANNSAINGTIEYTHQANNSNILHSGGSSGGPIYEIAKFIDPVTGQEKTITRVVAIHAYGVVPGSPTGGNQTLGGLQIIANPDSTIGFNLPATLINQTVIGGG